MPGEMHPLCLKITGGLVYDPSNGVEGQPRDVLIADGRVVDQLPPGMPTERVRIIDARGCTVMPGGIDMHTHIVALPQTTDQSEVKSMGESGTGFALPSPKDAGIVYARLGYTTVIEAAVTPDQADQVRAAIQQTPILDIGFLLELTDWPAVIDSLRQGDEASALREVARLMRETGAYGIKAVLGIGANTDAGARPKINEGFLDQPMKPGGVSPRRLLTFLSDAAHELNLPHPPHLHAAYLGIPGNIEPTLQTLELFGDRPVHLAHAQFYAYGQSADGGFASAAGRLGAFVKSHPNVTLDTGQVVFGPAWVVTRDRVLHRWLRYTLLNSDAPTEACDPFGFEYSQADPINALQWAIGLELALATIDTDQATLSMDHPNGGPFWAYPQVLGWLMDKQSRDRRLADAHPLATSHSGLAGQDRVLSIADVVRLTRSNPARALGLKNKGHLAGGADADVAIYKVQPDGPAKMFKRAEWVVKGGLVVVERGELCQTPAATLLSPFSDRM